MGIPMGGNGNSFIPAYLCDSAYTFIHSFISGMHHYEYVAPNVHVIPPEWTILSHVNCFVQGQVQ